MKKLSLGIIILAAFGLLSNSGGFSNPATGAPGDTATCGNNGCHSAGNFDPSVNITLTDTGGNDIERYLPGGQYLVNVNIVFPGQLPPSGYGFQMVCLDDQEAAVNAFSDLPMGVREFSANNRQYVVQSQRLPTGSIQVPWTAPDAGAVTFYAGAIAANANGNPNGDGATTGSATFAQGSASSEDLNGIEFSVYPNPVSQMLTIDGPDGTYQLFNASGEKLKSVKGNKIDMSDVNVGLYFIRIAEDSQALFQKIIKI